MLTRLFIRNLKRFREVEIELGNPVVFIGPNDSGKSTALQALALWDLGLQRWVEKRGGRVAPEKRPGVTINRRDLVAVPVPDANLLWRDLHVRDVHKIAGRQRTTNVRIDIKVDGVTDGVEWSCGLEFDYANDESFYCRPMRVSGRLDEERMAVPEHALQVQTNFLPPMSGMADREFLKQPGEVGFLIGQGRTAEVLRNLCYQILFNDQQRETRTWPSLVEQMRQLFGVVFDEPVFVQERGEILMSYRSPSGVRLDLSSSGRGLQQTLLLLAYLTVNPGSVLLLDEPDAHLEILRQRQIYSVLSEWAREHGSQIIAASHSEVILNEAADRDVVVAFVGVPHRMDDRGSQVLKSLKDIGFDQYYQAEEVGWVLYLEGSTDLAALRAFAKRLDHPAQAFLERPFVHYVGNQPRKAQDHFYGLREAKHDLVGLAIYDHLGQQPPADPVLRHAMWQRRELENYLCTKQTLLSFAEAQGREQQGELSGASWRQTMEESIAEIETALLALGKPSPWGPDLKASDEFLDPLFRRFYERVGVPNLMRKTDYHTLAPFVPGEALDQEIREKLDLIAQTAARARPRRD
ncbi:MAG: AAA family ATPase [Chloroflexi bacterium]|nr:AAA family ATPase [Chloroflexota bacterium]